MSMTIDYTLFKKIVVASLKYVLKLMYFNCIYKTRPSKATKAQSNVSYYLSHIVLFIALDFLRCYLTHFQFHVFAEILKTGLRKSYLLMVIENICHSTNTGHDDNVP